jgi:hypothetical protein
MFPLVKKGLWKNNLSLDDFIFDDDKNPQFKVLASLKNKIDHIQNNKALYRQKDDLKIMVDH